MNDDDDDFAVFDTPYAPGEATDECPCCGELIYNDAVRCPECGGYLSEEDAPARRKPAWMIAGVVICLVIVLLWVVGGMF